MTLEGEMITADPGDSPGRGIIYLKSAKVAGRSEMAI